MEKYAKKKWIYITSITFCLITIFFIFYFSKSNRKENSHSISVENRNFYAVQESNNLSNGENIEGEASRYLTKSQVEELVAEKIKQSEIDIMNTIYPIGSIYITTENINPNERFGGEWEAYGQGRTLIGAGTGTDINNTKNTFTIGATGGEYTHKLTTAELASHNHIVTEYIYGWQGWPTQTISGSYVRGLNNSGIKNTGLESVTDHIVLANFGVTSIIGGNGYHNNIQPYVVTYMWRRTK